jgi:hypothetical protein
MRFFIEVPAKAYFLRPVPEKFPAHLPVTEAGDTAHP